MIKEKRNYIHKKIKPFIKSSYGKAIWQILTTIIPYLIIMFGLGLMFTYKISLFFIIPTIILAALFLVRIFILFHDTTHGSFVPSKRGNDTLGWILGIFAFTPYTHWKNDHIDHHRTVGNVDKRGFGDVWTMTLEEYANASTFKRWGYRLYRNPIILFIIGPTYVFLFGQRMTFGIKKASSRKSIHITNAVIFAILLLAHFTIGLPLYFKVQIPVMMIASTLGVWLFYVQHQYEDVYWAKNKDWDVMDAGLYGSSVLKLPIILDWFTGFIGYHNVHHLNAKVPNYEIKKAYYSDPLFKESRVITLFETFKLLFLTTFDEKKNELITFFEAKKRMRLIKE
jgi:omega-6 fatty acid desaturase (delta-12 desaturase)